MSLINILLDSTDFNNWALIAVFLISYFFQYLRQKNNLENQLKKYDKSLEYARIISIETTKMLREDIQKLTDAINKLIQKFKS